MSTGTNRIAARSLAYGLLGVLLGLTTPYVGGFHRIRYAGLAAALGLGVLALLASAAGKHRIKRRLADRGGGAAALGGLLGVIAVLVALFGHFFLSKALNSLFMETDLSS